MPLDGITLKTITDELHQKLLGGKIDKISQAEDDEILFTIRNNKQNYKLLISSNSSNPRIYICNNYNKENPIKAPLFLMILRKYIGNGKIVDIKQNNLDRILLFEIESYNELRELNTKILYVEFMGRHSNIILIEKESNKIIDSIKRIPLSISSVREILPQRIFQFPPTQNKHNVFEYFTSNQIESILQEKNIEIYKSIYNSFEGISPAFAKELCFLSNIDPNQKTYELNSLQYERLQNSFYRIFNSIKNNKINPTLILDYKKQPIDFSCIPLNFYPDSNLKHFKSMNELCEEFYSQKDIRERINQKISSFKKTIQNRLDKIKLKYEKQIIEINEAKSSYEFSQKGELLKANIFKISKGMKEITVLDYNNEDLNEITIKLDENLTPSQNIQKYFKKYNKSKSRVSELSEQIIKTKEDINYFENILFYINSITSLEEIDEIKSEIFPNKNKEMKKNKNKNKKLSPYKYLSDDGTVIYVGRNNIQNDILTFKIANANDVWLHAKDIPGSHVIIKENIDNISNQTLYQAALLAGFYSKAKLNSKMEIDFTIRKNVKKIGSSKPGMVTYDNQSTIYVSSDKDNFPKQVE